MSARPPPTARPPVRWPARSFIQPPIRSPARSFARPPAARSPPARPFVRPPTARSVQLASGQIFNKKNVNASSFCLVKYMLCHMHNNHRAQAKFEIFANKVRELIIEHDVAFFFGDFNMRLFGMVPFLTQGPQATRAQQGSRASGSESGSRAGGSDQRAALQVTLLTRHVEFDQGTYTPEGPEKKNPITILDTVKHDSMGIFGVGRHEGVRRLGYQVHALVGASWPKLHDGKEFRAGYPSDAYTKCGANGPEPECEEAVGAVYDELHDP